MSVSEYDSDEDKYLDDYDPEFIEFKENAKTWFQLDDDIQTLNQAIKERKKKKNELTPELLDFMEKYKIHDLNTQDGHLKYQKTIRSQPVSKKYLILKLGDFFKNMNKSEKVVKFLYEGRNKKESYNLKRINPK
jgi:hypothetical protein